MDDTVYTKNYAFKFVHPPHLYIQRIFQMWRLLHYISLCILQMYLLKVSKKKILFKHNTQKMMIPYKNLVYRNMLDGVNLLLLFKRALT